MEMPMWSKERMPEDDHGLEAPSEAANLVVRITEHVALTASSHGPDGARKVVYMVTRGCTAGLVVIGAGMFSAMAWSGRWPEGLGALAVLCLVAWLLSRTAPPHT
jgi:hypothetical protein